MMDGVRAGALVGGNEIAAEDWFLADDGEGVGGEFGTAIVFGEGEIVAEVAEAAGVGGKRGEGFGLISRRL